LTDGDSRHATTHHTARIGAAIRRGELHGEKTMRWKAWLGSLAMVLAAVVGCKQQCFLTTEDYKLYMDQTAKGMTHDPELAAKSTEAPTGPPMTIFDTNREIRYMSLAECIAIALEQGTIGNTVLDNAGLLVGAGGTANAVTTALDRTATFSGANTTSSRFLGSDAIRVLRLDPAIAGLNIESSLSKFDAVWTSSASWQATDRPVGTALDAFQAQAGTNSIVQTDASVQTTLLKPLPTGGVAGITFGVPYTLTNLAARVNPAYKPDLQFQFEQPLLQGFGVEINQLRAAHPGSILSTTPLPNIAPTSEGILVTRIRFDQQRADFELKVQTMVANVELAYWNLYYAYWNLYAQEALLRANFETFRITEQRLKAGKVAAGDMALAKGQYEDARSQRLRALQSVLDNERFLRGMLQFRADDGTRLVPSDSPTIAPYQPDWVQGYQEAMTLRPELYQARQEVKAQQLTLIELKNELLPDLRFTSTYDLNSIGSRLDGPDATNALRQLASNHFNNWALGLRLTIPVGYRNQWANLRRGELSLARAYETLRDAEDKIERNLAFQYQRILANYELIRTNQAARIAYGDQMKVRLTLYKAGKQDATLNFVLQAQQQWAAALANEYQSIRDYNQSLVGWEFAKGTTLVRNNIEVAEGPLPSFAQVRAVEHEREKAAALKLRELPAPGANITDAGAIIVGPAVPMPGAPLPDVMKTTPLLKDVPPVGILSAPVSEQPAPANPSLRAEDQRGRPMQLPESLPMPNGQATPNGLPAIQGTPLPPIGSTSSTSPSTGRLPRVPGQFGSDRSGSDGQQ
jgi:outer membrane protein TolC